MALWRRCDMQVGSTAPPARPGRPERPTLQPPRAVPRRRITAAGGRIALIHAIAHIELNAVDLALDMASRYFAETLPVDFYDDWLGVADDEARHFMMLHDRLVALGSHYGDLAAHDGLWRAADATKVIFWHGWQLRPLCLRHADLMSHPP